MLVVVTAISLALGMVVASIGANISSGQGIHIMLHGDNYTNNSYIPITDIGNGNALLCVTNNTDCCGLPRRAGEWFYPNGSTVRIRSAGDDFFRGRGFRAVHLYRLHSAMSPTGLYRCVVPDSNGVNQTLYVHIGLNRVGSVAVSRDGDQFNSIRDPSANVTLTCIITIDSQLNMLTPPLNVEWSGPVYGTRRFMINKLVNISRTTYASIAMLNSPGAYYDSGEYECRADTTTGSTIILFQVPHRPSVSTSNGHTWLHLTWTQHENDVVTGYQLSYSYTGSCDYSPDDASIGSIQREYNITSLEEYSVYSITLITMNETGRSPPFEGTFTTEQSVPTGSPQSFNTTPFSTNITVQWDRINCLERNSEITRYSIRYGPSTTNSSEKTTTTVHGTNDNERAFTANRLEPLTSYTFEVAGVNRNGQRGPYSLVVEPVTLNPEIISMQLQVRDVSNCLHWRDIEPTSKIHDIVSSMVAAVNEICQQCNLTSSDLIEPFLMCFPQSIHQVTFRAQLKDRSQATAREIITYIEEWITSSNGARLTAYSVRLNLNNTCVILLSTIDDSECPGYLVPPTTLPNLENTSESTLAMNLPPNGNVQSSDAGVIVGGVFAMVFVVSVTFAVTVIGVLAMLKYRRVGIVEKRNQQQHGMSLGDLRHTPVGNGQHSITENEQQGPQPAVEMDNVRPIMGTTRAPNNEHQDSSVCYVNRGLYANVNRNQQMEKAGKEQSPTRDGEGGKSVQEIKYEIPD